MTAQDDSGPDTDGDGLSDANEALWGTDIRKTDTDGDEISDFDETDACPHPEPRSEAQRQSNARSYQCSDPTKFDTDGDTLDDGQEVIYIGTLPNNIDSDGDLISDYNEVRGFWWPLDGDANGRLYSTP